MGQVHISLETVCPEPRIQHNPERQHQLAVEFGHDRQCSSMGSEDIASHLQASRMKPDEKWVCYRKGGCTVVTEKLEEDGFAAADRNFASRIWVTITWAVYEGDVPIMRALWPILGGKRPRDGEAGPPGAWHGTRLRSRVGSMKVGFHNRGIQWDPPMAKWAGEGHDLTKLTAQRDPGQQRNQGNCRPSNLKYWRTEKIETAKNDCGLDQWPCQVENEGKYCGDYPEPSTGTVGPRIRPTTTDCRLGDTYLS